MVRQKDQKIRRSWSRHPFLIFLIFLFIITGSSACGTAALQVVPPASLDVDSVTLVETAPVETTLDHPSIPEASDVWPEMIGRARTSLDIAEFYVSDMPGSRLGPVLEAIEHAADRGVHVRLLVEESFYGKYPESVQRLGRHAGIETRRFDLHATMGGILHAKYFVVDRTDAYVGSQNLDYRSLEHIQEMGVRIHSPALSGQLDRSVRGGLGRGGRGSPVAVGGRVAWPARGPHGRRSHGAARGEPARVLARRRHVGFALAGRVDRPCDAHRGRSNPHVQDGDARRLDLP